MFHVEHFGVRSEMGGRLFHVEQSCYNIYFAAQKPIFRYREATSSLMQRFMCLSCHFMLVLTHLQGCPLHFHKIPCRYAGEPGVIPGENITREITTIHLRFAPFSRHFPLTFHLLGNTKICTPLAVLRARGSCSEPNGPSIALGNCSADLGRPATSQKTAGDLHLRLADQ